jgi:hypothetical protein
MGQTRHRRFAESTGVASHSCSASPCRDSPVLEQAHQFSPHERRGLHVVGAPTQRANRPAEVPGKRAQAVA